MSTENTPIVSIYPFGEATESLLSLHVEPSQMPSTHFPPQGRDNQIQIFFGTQMTRRDITAVMDLIFLILRRGWGEKQIYLTISSQAWRNPSVRNLVLDCPLGLRFMKVTVKDIDASTEAILVRNLHTGLSWRSTYTSYVDTFSADMLVTIPGLEVIELRSPLVPWRFNMEAATRVHQKLVRVFENLHYLFNPSLQEVFLSNDVVASFPQLVEVAFDNPFLQTVIVTM